MNKKISTSNIVSGAIQVFFAVLLDALAVAVVYVKSSAVVTALIIAIGVYLLVCGGIFYYAHALRKNWDKIEVFWEV